MSQRIGTSPVRMMSALVFIVSLLAALFVVGAPSAMAASSVTQCNSEHNIAGQAIECSYTVTNTLNGTATSSTVVSTHCHGAANAPPTMVCSSNTANSTDLVTSVGQCNYAGDGGGGTMKCSVDVVNNITGTVAPTPAAINQCNGSADGSGVASCNPFPASASGAKVTQCNDSGNGGGSTVTCTVHPGSTTTSLLSVSINQCNNSENGGGSTVECRARLRNNVTPPAPSPTPTPTAPVDDTDDDTDDGDGGGGSGGGGAPPVVDTDTATPDVGGPGGGTPGEGITTQQVSRVPSGGASTGGGSTSGIENLRLLLLGGLLLAASAPALALGRRIRARV